MLRVRAGSLLLTVLVVATLALVSPVVRGASLYDYDLRWDGAGLLGSQVLNPAELTESDTCSFTLSARSAGGDCHWLAQYVRPESTGLTGGLIVGDQDEALTYGVAGKLGAGLGVGVSLRGMKRNDFEHETNIGLLARAGVLAAGVARRIPWAAPENGETEWTLGIRHRIVGVEAGYVSGEAEPRTWLGLRMALADTVSIAHVADVKSDWSRSGETTSLKIGQNRYLMLTRKSRPDGEPAYSAAIGVTF